MTYVTLLSNEGAISQFLAVIKPRRLAGAWELISGTKYKQGFDFGEIVQLFDGATEETGN